MAINVPGVVTLKSLVRIVKMMKTTLNNKMMLKAIAIASAALISFNVLANSGTAYFDPNNTGINSTPEATFYANSPVGIHDASACYTASGSGAHPAAPATCDSGTAIRKFVNPLPLPKLPGGASIPAAAGKTFFSAPSVLDNTPTSLGKYIPVAVPTKWVNPIGQVTGDDYYEIAAVEYKERMHSDLANPTVFRGYVQIDPAATDSHAGINNQELPVTGSQAVPLFQVNGTTPILVPRPDLNNVLTNATHITSAGVSYALVQAYAVDYPHYFGPIFTASRNVPTRIKFINLLPVGRASGAARNGDIFLPVDESLSGAGFGPDGKIKYTQNRANIHLFGGDTPWISNGNPHQWITPAQEALASSGGLLNTVQDLATSKGSTIVNQYLRGWTATNVPDMVDPGPGAMTYFYPNGGSARLEWLQDQSFGMARLNVYAGLTSMYLLSDPADTLANAYEASNTLPREQIPLVFQDKTFVPKDIAVEDARWDTTLWGGESSLWYPHVYETNQYYTSKAVTTAAIKTVRGSTNPATTSPALYSSCTNNLSRGRATTTWTCVDATYVSTGSTQTAGPGLNPPGRWDWGPWFWPVFPSAFDRLPTGEHLLSTNTISGLAANSGWSEVTTTTTAYLDTPLVNGQAYPTLTVDPKAYRFRMLNAGSDRYLNLGLYLAADKQTTDANKPNSPTSQPEICDGRTTRKNAGPLLGTALNVSDCTEVKMVAMDGSYPTLYYPGGATPASPDGVLAFPTTGGLMGTGWGDPSGQLAEGVPDPATIGPDLYLIGNDAGYLANMVDIPSTPVNYETNKRSITVLNVLEHGLYLGAGNRADVVVDFSKYAGKTLILYNDAPSASPAGDARLDYLTSHGSFADVGGVDNVKPGFGPNTRTMMQIHVSNAVAATPVNTSSLQNATAALFAQNQPMPIVPQPDFKAAYPTNANISTTQTMGTVMTGFICGTSTTSACTSGANAYQGLSFKSMQTLTYMKASNACATAATAANGTQNACRAQATATTVNAGGNVTNAFLETKTIQELFEPTIGRMNATLGLELPYTSAMVQTTIPLQYVDPITDTVQDGITAFWRITHNGLVDHPVHFEYVNVQIINRVGWDGTLKPVPMDEIGWKDTIITHPLEDIFVAVTPKAPRVPFGMTTSQRPMDPSQAIGVGGSDPSLANANGQIVSGFTQVDPTTGNGASVSNQMADFKWEYEWRSAALSDVAIDMMRPMVFDYWSVNGRSAKTGTTKVFANLPLAPTLLAFNGVGLSWTDPTPANAAATITPDPKNEIGFIVTAVETYGSNPSTTKTYSLPANQTVWIDKDLVAGRNYTFTVAAYNTLGTGPASAPVTVAYSGATLAPVLTAVSPNTTSVDLVWGNTSLQAINYDVMYGTTNPPTTKFTTITSAGSLDLANLVAVTGLTPNTTYNFQVIANAATVQKSNVVAIATNSAGATGLTASATGATTASVAWTMGAGGGTPTVTISPAAGVVTLLPAVGGLINGATVTGLAANTSYTITLTVKGINSYVASTAVTGLTTNVGSATALVSSAITTNTATIAWNNPTGAVSQTVTITPSTVAGISGSAVATISAAKTSAALTNLAPNTLYTVTVREVGVNGSATTASTTFTTTPGTVSAVSFAGVSNGAGTITWTLPVGGGTVAVKATPAATIVTSNVAGNTSATVTGLVSGTTYSFTFIISGGAGVARPGATITQTFYAANAPTLVTATLSAANQAVIKFTTTAALTKFGVNVGTSSTGPWTTLSSTTTIVGGVSGTSTVTAGTNFLSGNTYYFQVVPLNATNVQGTPSAPASIALTAAPLAVTGVTATQGVAKTINLSWIKSSNNASTVTIFRRLGTTTGAFAQVGTAIAGNLTTYADTGLTTGTTYQYYVVNSNAFGPSPASGNSAGVAAP